jgi:hypothetical protein
MEIRGAIPFSTFSKLTLSFANQNRKNPLLLLRIAASFASLKHLAWYLR